MATIFYKLRYFLLTTFIYFGIGIVLFLNYKRATIHAVVNQYNAPWADLFFKYYTHIGYGATALLILPYLFFKRSIRTLLLGISTIVTSGVMVQLLKKLVFGEFHRPAFVLESFSQYHLVEGVLVHQFFTFPSGHSATSFAFFIFLAFLFSKNHYSQILFAFLAILSAFSRIYLSQHFMIDTVGGGLVGVFGFTISYYWVYKIKSKKLDTKLIHLFYKSKG